MMTSVTTPLSAVAVCVVALPCVVYHGRMDDTQWRQLALEETQQTLDLTARGRRLQYEVALVQGGDSAALGECLSVVKGTLLSGWGCATVRDLKERVDTVSCALPGWRYLPIFCYVVLLQRVRAVREDLEGFLYPTRGGERAAEEGHTSSTNHPKKTSVPVAVALRLVHRLEAELWVMLRASERSPPDNTGPSEEHIAATIGNLAALWAASTKCAPTRWMLSSREGCPPPPPLSSPPPERLDKEIDLGVQGLGSLHTTIQDENMPALGQLSHSESSSEDDDDTMEGMMFGLPIPQGPDGRLELQHRRGNIRSKGTGKRPLHHACAEPSSTRGHLLAELKAVLRRKK